MTDHKDRKLPMVNGKRQYVIIENRGTERDPWPFIYQGHARMVTNIMEDYQTSGLDTNGDFPMPPRMFLIGDSFTLTEVWVVAHGSGRFTIRHSDQTVPDINIDINDDTDTIQAESAPA